MALQPQQPPPFHESFLDPRGGITEIWRRFLLKSQAQITIPGNLTLDGAFNATFTLTGPTSVIFPTSGTLLTSTSAATSIIGTANEIAASSPTGTVVLSLIGPHNFATLAQNGVLYGNGVSAIQALAVNATATRKFLTQVSSGVPAWLVIAAGDVPDLSATYSLVAGNAALVTVGKLSTYNAIATVSNGVAAEYATIDTTGLTANVAASTLYAVPASGAGMYRISAYVVETTAGSVSSVLPNVQIVYTDKDSNVSVTIDATPILGAAGLGQTGALNANAGGTVSSGVIVIYVKASTTIQYQTSNYASVAAGMTYALHLKLEAL
jgi:hypothetical protein